VGRAVETHAAVRPPASGLRTGTVSRGSASRSSVPTELTTARVREGTPRGPPVTLRSRLRGARPAGGLGAAPPAHPAIPIPHGTSPGAQEGDLGAEGSAPACPGWTGDTVVVSPRSPAAGMPGARARWGDNTHGCPRRGPRLRRPAAGRDPSRSDAPRSPRWLLFPSRTCRCRNNAARGPACLLPASRVWPCPSPCSVPRQTGSPRAGHRGRVREDTGSTRARNRDRLEMTSISYSGICIAGQILPRFTPREASCSQPGLPRGSWRPAARLCPLPPARGAGRDPLRAALPRAPPAR